ncbi:MAG: spore maturation protein [Oscillospiraceae bacterium]|nr:spore maturation protein [Oscillospiraceae bacterium]
MGWTGSLGDLVVPVAVVFLSLWGLFQKVPVFDCFLEGAAGGIRTAVRILPALVGLMTAVSMFRASGALDVLTWALRPLAGLAGFPEEAIPLALLRPVSGSGALVIFEDILANCGPDSFAGRVASVLQGSTETTFYTIAVYYGAVKVSRTRHTLPAAVVGDLTGFIASALLVRFFFGP